MATRNWLALRNLEIPLLSDGTVNEAYLIEQPLRAYGWWYRPTSGTWAHRDRPFDGQDAGDVAEALDLPRGIIEAWETAIQVANCTHEP